jgi:hypothetical protein
MLKLTKLGVVVKSLTRKEDFVLDRLTDESWLKCYPSAINDLQFNDTVKSLKEKGLIEGE